MTKYFNNRVVELLAPAGNFEIFKEIINLGCDAVYFGGKNLNMRLHRKDYNFSNEELFEAVKIAHSMGKKAYITVNNLYNDEEIEELKEFLLLLNEIKPDALIVQDMSVISLIKEMDLDLQIHSSVMMNVHNLQSLHVLKEHGVSRVVLSRELPLSYSKYLAASIDMEFEYFIHGDMCIAHGSQCLYSGMLFAQSSNRGRCLKPCRWGYKILHNGKEYNTEYPMAVKDMCMNEHIPELIDGGITSFKIEGRMRNVEYLKSIIEIYRDNIDRYLDDPLSYDRTKNSDVLYENRKRDTSTAYAFGNSGLSNINTRYEGTGKLFSSGKMFSTATEEREITKEKIEKINETLHAHSIDNKEKPRLSVKVNNLVQAKLCLNLKVNDIYLAGDVFLPDKPFSKKEIKELLKIKGETNIYLCMPHMTFDLQVEQYKHLLSYGLKIDGLMTTNIGGISAFKNNNLIGDYSLNILNQKSADFYLKQGIKKFTISTEASVTEAISIINNMGSQAEMIVHGSPTVMYLEHDLFDNVDKDKVNEKEILYLVDDKLFKHPVYKDQYNRNHMLLYKNICYLPILKGLYNAGLKHFRIEGQHLTEDELSRVITTYHKALNDLDICETLYEDFKPNDKGCTLGAFEF